jgi:hypothetical protein
MSEIMLISEHGRESVILKILQSSSKKKIYTRYIYFIIMPFTKSFPREIPGSNYPKWEDVHLTDEEEKEQEKLCREDNISLFIQCIEDASLILKRKELKIYQSDIIRIASSLFEKRASYSVHYKERKAKEKFEKSTF